MSDETQGGATLAVVEKADPTLGDKSQAAATGGEPAIEAAFIPYETPATKETQSQPLITEIDGNQFLEPVEPPLELYRIYQNSALLEPIIDSFATNVYKAGWALKPTIDFDKEEEATKLVHDALLWEKSGGDPATEAEVSDDEVAAAIKKLKTRATIEKMFLQRYFEAAVPDMSYRMLWELTGQDWDVTAMAYWEIVRDTAGRIARFQWVPSIFVRATRQEPEQVTTGKWVRDSVLKWVREPQIRRFRKWAQIRKASHTNIGNVVAWFKEFGDPRVMSRTTGKYYETVDAMVAAEQGDDKSVPLPLPATELLIFRDPFGASSVYGKPRWSGSIPALLGSRELDEENLKIAADEAIPSVMLLVSGGIVGSKSVDRLEAQIKNRTKGRKGILLIEAQAAGKGPVTPTQTPTMQIERMKSQQNSDALFQNYDKRNEEKVLGSFRMPRALQGKDLGQNRATTLAMLRYAEEQIFQPRREDLDEVMNNTVLADLGITCWRYETRSRAPKDPQVLTEVVTKLTEAGLLSPNEARQLITGIFNKEFDSLTGLWARMPPRVLTVMLQTKNVDIAKAMLGTDEKELDKLLAAGIAQQKGAAPGEPAPPVPPTVKEEDDDGADRDAGGPSGPPTNGGGGTSSA
jgi:capsid portal protein